MSEVEDALIHLGCQARVLTLDPMRLDEVIASIGTVGAATGRDAAAAGLMSLLRARLGALAGRLDGARSRPVLVLEWTDPPFNAGHWVPDMVAAAGGADVLGRAGGRSEAVTWDLVQAAAAEVVIVAPCGFRLDGALSLAEQLTGGGCLPPGAEVWAVDADAYLVRPGPRVVDGCEMLASVLHPDRCGRPDLSRARRVA